jgi:hypothetical protein
MTGTRLDDCTPAPDAEREAQKLSQPAILPDCMLPDGADPCKGYQRLREVIEGQGLSMTAMDKELREARIAIQAQNGVRASLDADVMEIARVVLGYTADPAWIINDPQRFPDVHAVARALTEYGDQCVAKAGVTDERDAARAEIAEQQASPPECAPPEADVMERAHKVISDWRPDWPIAAIGDATKLIQILVRALTAYGDQRAREARASAIEEAGAALRQSLGRVLAPKIRALAVAPPQSEGGEG